MLYIILVILICICRFAIHGHATKSLEAGYAKKDDVLWRKKHTFQAEAQNPFSSRPRTTDSHHKRAMEDVKKAEECDNEFVIKLSSLLNKFNISIQSRDIENLRTHMKVKTSRNKLSGLYFITVLNLKKVYPESDEVRKKVFEIDNLTSILKRPIFTKSFGPYALKRTKLLLNVENIYQANKSVVEIKFDIDLMHNYTRHEDIYTYFERSGVVRNFFETENKLKRKKLRVQKFSFPSVVAGSVLALLSSILCGLSFAFKKWRLVRMDKDECYYLDKKWWMSQSLMIIGDILHFIAYSFAPAIVVSTLQIVTVIVTAFASSKILGEKLHKYGKLAFALSLGGCLVIVFHVPNEPQIYNIDTFLYMISSYIFLIYIVFLSVITILLISYWIPKYGETISLAYTVQSSIFGSVIVLGLKGTILGYTDTLSHWLPWTSLFIVSVFLILQLECLNKALVIYNTLVVTTQYYVLYSGFVILSSCLLFKVWKTSNQEMIFTNFCGLMTIALGALILTIFEEGNATFDFSRLFAAPKKRT